MTERIDAERARELLAAATPGPWRACGANDGRCRCGLVWSIPADDTVCRVYADTSFEGGNGAFGEAERIANTALLVAAPDLAAAVVSLTEERDAAIAERDAAITAVKRCSGLRKEAKDGAWLRQTAVHAGLGELEGAAAFHAITDQGEKLSAALATARERIASLEAERAVSESEGEALFDATPYAGRLRERIGVLEAALAARKFIDDLDAAIEDGEGESHTCTLTATTTDGSVPAPCKACAALKETP